MAEIKKIKVNGTEYDVQPEWAGAGQNPGNVTIASPDYPMSAIELGTLYGQAGIQIGGFGWPNYIYAGSSGSDTRFIGEGARCDLAFADVEIGYADSTINLNGTVLVNGEAIGASVPWADYDSGTKALSIGAEGNVVKIGTANGVLKLGTGVTGVEIGMGTATANIFDGQMYLEHISDPYYLIWLGTHDGKISVGDPDDGMDGARVLIGTDSISMGSTAKALTIGTDCISMGTGGMTIGTDCISMGTGGMTIGTSALMLGSAALWAGYVTLDWTGLTAGGDNCMVTVGDTTLSRYGLSVIGGTNGLGVWRNGDGLTLGALSDGCSLSANPTANIIEIGTKGGSDAEQPSLVLNGVTLSYDATAGTVTLSADGKSATIQLS